MKRFVLFFVICCCCLAACKDEDPIIDPVEGENEIKFMLNGSVFSNKFVSFNDFFDSATSVGYIDSIDATEVKTVAQFNNSPVTFWLRFPGQQTGDFTFNEPTIPITDYPADNKYFELGIGVDTLLGGFAIQQIDIEVSKYDTVGGRIKGTFEGTVYDYTTGAEISVDISNGQFDMERQY